ncbi:unnamed protein product [Phytophthora lilii]|uniref:Unnamed protein product n=1 Tax=Phytophthora lilii TaxID=2077276 RepID=A0A9W7D802_9STRA|nr:unnamed protein product [Phytophthora lilii]
MTEKIEDPSGALRAPSPDTCKAMTRNATACSRNALKSGYCRQHDKDEKIRMYRKELARMHQRVRRYLEISNDLNQKLMDIKRLDYIKSRLIMIGGPHMPFRAVLANPCFKDEVESLFATASGEPGASPCWKNGE